MELRKEWAFVARYNGKKVNKYVTACEELDKYEWISATKFWFRDENNTYCEGIMLAKEDDEQTLRDMISKKSPRCPHNAFSPFPDPSIKPIDMVEKWKKKLATIAMNDFLIPNKRYEAFDKKEAPRNRVMEKPFVEITNPKEGNDTILPIEHDMPKLNHRVSLNENELLQARHQMDPTSTQVGEDNEIVINEINEAVTSPEVSSEEDDLPINSKNVIKYVRNGRKTLLLARPQKKTMNYGFVIYPKNNKKETSNEGMISKKKYDKLLQKYKLLKAILSEQSHQYTMDFQIQQLAQCLYKAIKERYNDEDGDDE